LSQLSPRADASSPQGQVGAQPVLKAQQLRLTYHMEAQKLQVLAGVDIALYKGQSVGVIGPSGSGKSSLLMALAGLEPLDSGQIFFQNTEITQYSEDQMARWRRDYVGIVFQDFHLIPHMTAQQNVSLPMELAGRKQAFAAADQALEQVGLSHRRHHYPHQLSGGEQQRVAIARAIMHQPALVLADEPTGNLDQETAQTIIHLLFDLCQKSQTALFLITHDSNLARHVDKQYVMRGGVLHVQQDDKAASSIENATPPTDHSEKEMKANLQGPAHE